jgi:hypothetical protein
MFNKHILVIIKNVQSSLEDYVIQCDKKMTWIISLKASHLRGNVGIKFLVSSQMWQIIKKHAS